MSQSRPITHCEPLALFEESTVVAEFVRERDADNAYQSEAALEKADGLALGSPVYFGNVTGAMRSFQERLCFPYLVYDRRRSTIAPRRLAMACIYTMNVDAETMRQHGYPETLAVMDGYLGRIFSTPSVLYVTDTWQFDDYARYVADRFSEADKRRRREEQFPQECRQAFVMGQEMVQKLAGQGA